VLRRRCGGGGYIGEFVLYRETENEEMIEMATMGTISHGAKGLSRYGQNFDGYHGYHERSLNEVGLQMDSTEALFKSTLTLGRGRKYMKTGPLSVVARDGIEPPTPAFSGLESSRVIILIVKDKSRSVVPKTANSLGQ
jgi:hypothetical protein